MMTNEKKEFQEVINYLFWLFLLQGISLILLGVLIHFYPGIIVGLVIAGFVWLGLSSIVTGFRVRKLGKTVSEFDR